MKKMFFAAIAVAVVGMSVQTTQAGDREWATVGKVLTGVAAGAVIARAVDGGPTYVSASYGYATPAYSVTVAAPAPCPPPAPVVYAPAPVVYAPAPVVYAPAPVVYVAPPRPVYYAPAPVYVGYGYRGHGHYYRGCR